MFLITEGDNAGKFIGKADERLKVSKLEIRDKDTNQLLKISLESENVVVELLAEKFLEHKEKFLEKIGAG